MAKIRPGGQITAHRAAKRPSSGKPKLSRVTSGYGGSMIPLSRVCLSQEMGFYSFSAKKCRISGKNGPQQPTRGPPCNGVNTKMLSIGCPVMIVTTKLDHFQKWIWGQKNAFLVRNSAFFYATPIFLLRRTRLNWIISPP